MQIIKAISNFLKIILQQNLMCKFRKLINNRKKMS